MFMGKVFNMPELEPATTSAACGRLASSYPQTFHHGYPTKKKIANSTNIVSLPDDSLQQNTFFDEIPSNFYSTNSM